MYFICLDVCWMGYGFLYLTLNVTHRPVCRAVSCSLPDLDFYVANKMRSE